MCTGKRSQDHTIVTKKTVDPYWVVKEGRKIKNKSTKKDKGRQEEKKNFSKRNLIFLN